MSLDTLGGPAALAARIGELESLVGARRPASTTTATAASAAAGTRFGDLLRTLSAGASASTSASALTSAPTSAPRAGSSGEQAVELAKTYTGVPYLWGGTDPEKGLDCSGLTQLVFRQLGVDLPRVSRDQARVGSEVASLADARPGDLVFFGSPVHHVGIYAGDGKMVDAPRRGRTVGLHDVWDGVTAIRRVLPDRVADGAGAGSPATFSTFATPSPLAAQQAAAQLLAASVPTATVNELLASASGYGPSAPGGIMGQAGAKLVPVPTGTAATSATAALSALAQLSGPSGVAGVGVAEVGGAAGTASGTAPWASAPYADLFRAAGERHGVDPALLSAVAKAESGYRASVRSHAGAIGLMQIMPGTARELDVDPTDPVEAVDGAARLLKSHLRSFGGDVDLALAAYNAGPGAVRRYDGVPPYAETQAYVRRVNAYWKDLR